MFVASLLAFLSIQSSANPAKPVRLPLVAQPGSEERAGCTADKRRCVALTIGDDGQPLPVVRASVAPAGDALQGSDESYAVWPSLVVLPDGGFLAGVEVRTSTSYSGGGGSATELRLFRMSPEGEAHPTPVLNVPTGGSLMIRACFSKADMKHRRGACHDEYSFSADLDLAEGSAGALPDLTYASIAEAFPRGASRFADSTDMRLKKSDLVRGRDARCSVTRRFRFDVAAGSYRPETPLPDCSDYTTP